MGGGSWTTSAFTSYSKSVGRSVDCASGTVIGTYSSQQMFQQSYLDAALNPYKIMRECIDTEEHPNTFPVIIALDVTGSMGKAAVEVAKNINSVVTESFDKHKDVEFLFMGIGDLAYDDAPIQMSQFESDVRIAEQIDKVYFEYGGGGNAYESYTAAWYMGARHTKLDCWQRGKKGVIITLGDERLNPYLPANALTRATGDHLQDDIESADLYKEACEKFDIYHIDVRHGNSFYYDSNIEPSWKELLDDAHFKSVSLDEVTATLIEIIGNASEHCESVSSNADIQRNEAGEIVW